MTDTASPSPDPSQEEYDETKDGQPTTPSKRKATNKDGTPRKTRTPKQSTGAWTKDSKAALFKHYIGKPSESEWKEIEKVTGKTRKQCADYWRNILMVKLMKAIEEGA